MFASLHADVHLDAIRPASIRDGADPKTSNILSAPGFDGCEEQSVEDSGFMIDLTTMLTKGRCQV